MLVGRNKFFPSPGGGSAILLKEASQQANRLVLAM
jgi:hypothetical protein